MQWFNQYLLSPTHKWWVDNVWRPSWTRFVSLISGVPATLIAGAQQIEKWANDTTISNYLAQVGVPNWVPSAMAIIALVYYVAHGHDD